MDSTREHEQSRDVTIFGDRSQVHGTVSGPVTILVQGKYQGRAECAHLVVTRQGEMIADNETEELEVWGTLKGFTRTQRALCRKSAVIEGFIMANAIALEPGVTVEGGIAFPRDAEEKDEGKEGS